MFKGECAQSTDSNPDVPQPHEPSLCTRIGMYAVWALWLWAKHACAYVTHTHTHTHTHTDTHRASNGGSCEVIHVLVDTHTHIHTHTQTLTVPMMVAPVKSYCSRHWKIRTGAMRSCDTHTYTHTRTHPGETHTLGRLRCVFCSPCANCNPLTTVVRSRWPHARYGLTHYWCLCLCMCVCVCARVCM